MQFNVLFIQETNVILMLSWKKIHFKYVLNVFLPYVILGFLVPLPMHSFQRNNVRSLELRFKSVFSWAIKTLPRDTSFIKRVKNKFLFNRDIIFLEFSKNDNVVERQLDHLEWFIDKKYYFEANC